MKIKAVMLYTILTFCLFAKNLPAADFKLKGWVEDKMSVSGTDYTLGDIRELRLMLDSSLAKQITFTGQVYGKLFLGDTAVTADSELRLDRALLTVNSNKTTIRIGRQRLAWGTGFIWNPTDIFNTVDLTDLKYTRKGIDAVEIVNYPSDLSALSCLVTFSENEITRVDKFAFNGKTNIKNCDMSLSLISQTEGRIDKIGADFSGTIFNLFGLRAEQLYDISLDKLDISVGSDYRFSEHIYAFTEYYRNELAVNNMIKNYLYLGVSYIVDELTTIGTGIVLDLDTSMALFSGNLEYSLSNDTYLNLSFNFYSMGIQNTHYLKLRFNF